MASKLQWLHQASLKPMKLGNWAWLQWLQGASLKLPKPGLRGGIGLQWLHTPIGVKPEAIPEACPAGLRFPYRGFRIFEAILPRPKGPVLSPGLPVSPTQMIGGDTMHKPLTEAERLIISDLLASIGWIIATACLIASLSCSIDW